MIIFFRIKIAYLLGLLWMLTTCQLYAQTVLLEKDVDKSFSQKNRGPNRKHFSHFYMGYSFASMYGNADSAKLNNFGNYGYQIGYRYKLRLTNYYAIGYDILYFNQYYSLKQDSSKILPNKILHEKEKLNFYNLELNLYNRFNFGKRGDHIGKFVDIGVYGDWTFYCVNSFKDKLSNGYIARTSLSRLDYYEPFNYGAFIRFGISRYVVFAQYRYSNLFKTKFNYPELPRLTTGFQIGFHQ